MSDVSQNATVGSFMLLVVRLLFWLAVLGALVVACLPATFALPAEPDDKLQHIAAFAVLSALAACAYPRARLTTLLLALALFGGLIEIVQGIAAVGRDADVFDWAADIAASAVMLVLMSDLRPLIVRGSADRANEEGRRGWLEPALVVLLLVALVGTGALLLRETEMAQLSGPLLSPAKRLAVESEMPVARGVAAVAKPAEPVSDGMALPQTALATPPKASVPPSNTAAQAATGEGNSAGPKPPPGARETTLPVTIGGAAKGQLRLAVDQTSLIYADSGQLAALLPGQASILKDLGPGYVSLIALRRAGIDLRYDRDGDSIEIAPK